MNRRGQNMDKIEKFGQHWANMDKIDKSKMNKVEKKWSRLVKTDKNGQKFVISRQK